MPSVTELFSTALSYHESGRLNDAIALYRAVLAQQPQHHEALHLLGVAEHQLGHHEVAIELISQAVQLQPRATHYLCNLAEAQRAAKRPTDAEQSLRRAIAIAPNLSVAHNNLALLLDETGRAEEARVEYEAAIRSDPRNADAYVNLARHFGRARDLKASAAAAQRAIALVPNRLDAQTIAGYGLATIGVLSAGIEHLRIALKMQPDAAVAWNLANALREIGEHDECLRIQRQAMALAPDDAEVHGKLLFDLHYVADLPAQTIADEHFAWGHKFSDAITPLPPVHVERSHQRIRVGYVSADFRRHSVGGFFRPLLAAHDRSVVEIYCYSNTLPDSQTPQFMQLADHWRDIRNLSDDDTAAAIRADEMDILIDLSGHTSGNRLPVFARKPAPIQATYLGYPDTTGMRASDYRITDAICDPPGKTEGFHTEQLACVSSPFVVFAPPIDAPPIAPLRDVAGEITFGSFNRPSKISPQTIAMWAEILRQVPSSRLLVKGYGLGEEQTRARWRDRFARAGVNISRIEFLGFTARPADHFLSLSSADIALDTFPYNGTTTTCEAMWMGLPVISLIGLTHVSRVGASLLNSVGLSEFVTDDPKQYVKIAVDLAHHPPRLRELRRTMRDRMQSSPLMDANRLARDFEALFQNWMSVRR